MKCHNALALSILTKGTFQQCCRKQCFHADQRLLLPRIRATWPFFKVKTYGAMQDANRLNVQLKLKCW